MSRDAKRIKGLATLLAIAMLISLLTACGGGKTSEPETETVVVVSLDRAFALILIVVPFVSKPKSPALAVEDKPVIVTNLVAALP